MTLAKSQPHRPTTHAKKRVGQHHRKSQHYLKSYWPYLPILAVLGLGVLTNSLLSRNSHSVLGYATSISNQVLLSDTNAQRSSNQEANLQLNTELSAAAQAKANDMATQNYWSHVSPDGTQPWSFIENAGYQYQTAGENLAYGFGNSDAVIRAWMQSPEHRANILNGQYMDVGFATANVANYQGHGPATIVVAEYGQPIANLTSVTAEVRQGPAITVAVSNNIQPVSRVSLLSSSPWLPLSLAMLCGALLTAFFIRHAFVWHKVLVRGEQFVLHHPGLDILVVGVVTFGLVLSHIAGTIL